MNSNNSFHVFKSNLVKSRYIYYNSFHVFKSKLVKSKIAITHSTYLSLNWSSQK